MQKLRTLGLLWASLPVLVATVTVASMLAGCGGSGTTTSAPPTLPGTLQGQVQGLITFATPFIYSANFSSQNPPVSPQQQGNCPQVINNPNGSITLDFGSGCTPFPGAPVHSGSITIQQHSVATSVSFNNFNAGGGSVISGGFTYVVSDPSSGSLSVSGEFTATPAGGGSCSVTYGFSGTLTSNSSGYVINGEGLQIINSGANEVRYRIQFSGITGAQPCPYPAGGTAQITPVNAAGNPIGSTTTVIFGPACGVAQVQSGGTTYTVSLQNLPPFNPCAMVQ